MVNDEIKKLLYEHGNNVTNLCKRLYKNSADDLYQETWYNAIKYFYSWDKTKPFDKWIYAICFNTYKKLLKKSNIKNEYDFFDNDHKDYVLNNIPDTDFSPDDRLSLLSVVDALPEIYKQVIIIYYFDHFSVADVAAIMKISESAVKFRLYKARNLIKERME